MAEPLKDRYNKKFIKEFNGFLLEVVPSFDEKGFTKLVFGKGWKERELKDRMKHIAHCLSEFLPGTYKQQVKILVKTTKRLIAAEKHSLGLEYMLLPDFIEQFGLEEPDTAIKAFEQITPFTSCEFGVRPFTLRYPEKMMRQFLAWSKHKNLHVRRLATEGCRPRLPWAKDHPELVIQLAKKWFGKTTETDKLIKHASRTLLKQGNPELMKLFGFGNPKHIHVEKFKILTPKVKVGGGLSFEFSLKNAAKKATLIRLEYAIYYQKANGSLSKKVYKISEKEYAGNSTTGISKTQSFRPITTRVFHKGLHQVAVVINGVEGDCRDFILV